MPTTKRQDSLAIFCLFFFVTIVFPLFFFSSRCFFISHLHCSLYAVCWVCVSPWSIYHKWIWTIKWMDEWNASAFFLKLGSLFFYASSFSSLFALQLCIFTLMQSLFGPMGLFVLLFFIIFLCVCAMYSSLLLAHFNWKFIHLVSSLII